MSKYINADKLVEKYLEEEIDYPTDDYFEGYIDGIIVCHSMVDEMPSADVVEIVNCKDCRHCKYIEDSDTYYCDRRYPRRETEPDGYCNYGEVEE